MNILIIDELPVYVQGLCAELKRILPDCQMQSAKNMDEVWLFLERLKVTVILLDGDIESLCCMGLLEQLSLSYPELPVVLMLRKITSSPFQHLVKGVVARGASAEKISQVLAMVESGMVCLPDILIPSTHSDNKTHLLTQRQLEILRLLAAGDSNKQISRLLNISLGTVKAHIESIFNRLNVHNRTQAAMVYHSNHS